MKSTLEKISSIKQGLSVEAPAEAVDKAYLSAMEKVRKEAKVPGFRKGKVPDSVIEGRFGEDLTMEAIKELVRATYPKAVEEAGAKPLADPTIEPGGKLEKGKPFSYKAIFEVYPEFTAEGYEGLKLESEKIEVTDEEVEGELRRLQRQMTQLEPAPGMIAMIDFKGTAGGAPFAGSEAENYVVDFGAGNLLEEFEVQIAGMKASEERDIEFDYPKGYFKKEIAGKRGAFRVKLKELRKKIVPELGDEFAKELGSFTTIGDVRSDLKKRIAEYKDSIQKNALREQAIRQLIEKHKDLEAPTPLVEAELGNMIEQLDRQLKAQGKSLADAKIDGKQFVHAHAKEAASRARGYMIVNAIAAQEKIDVTDEEFGKKLEEMAAANRQPLEKIREHMEKNNLMGQVRSQMRFEKTLDFVLSKAKISKTKPKKEEKDKK
ncbi:MAG TPA: trigger factor [bacterium]|nr:trigger factor [bacterium]